MLSAFGFTLPPMSFPIQQAACSVFLVFSAIEDWDPTLNSKVWPMPYETIPPVSSQASLRLALDLARGGRSWPPGQSSARYFQETVYAGAGGILPSCAAAVASKWSMAATH